MVNVKKPNFFIVGAPKCGTTALSEYLKIHPNIFICEPKEPNFFCLDFPRIREVKSLNEYLQLFQNAGEEKLAIGEASSRYLYSSVAIKKIYEFNSNAKIIIMLRNPVDMIYSFHSQQVFNLDEKVKDFKRAWQLQSVRKGPFTQYFKIGLLGLQVERVYRIFPREQIFIILFEDFVNATNKVYEDVQRFLNVPLWVKNYFPRFNPNKTHKYFIIAKLVKNTPNFLTYPIFMLKKIFNIQQIGILDKLWRANIKVQERKPLPIEFRKKLLEMFKPDIQRLSRIIQKDLDHWLE